MASSPETIGRTISCSVHSLSPVTRSSATTVTGDLGQVPSQGKNGECTSASSSAFFSEHEPCPCELCIPRAKTLANEPSQASPSPPTADDLDLGESEEVDDARRLQAALECYSNGSLSDTDSLLEQLERLERHLRKNRPPDDKSSTLSDSPQPSLSLPSPSTPASPASGPEFPPVNGTSHSRTQPEQAHESHHSPQPSQSSALSASASANSLKPPLMKRSSSSLSTQNHQSTTVLCLLERPPYAFDNGISFVLLVREKSAGRPM